MMKVSVVRSVAGGFEAGSMKDNADNMDEGDREVVDRLAQLGRAPVDATDLKSRLEVLIDIEERPSSQLNMTMPLKKSWRVPLGWAAIVLISSSMAAYVLLTSNHTLNVVTPADLVRIHEHYHEKGMMLKSVNNVGDANSEMARQWASAPPFPVLEGAEIEACCLNELCGCRVACLHLKSNGQNVTMVVGNARDIRLAGTRDVESRGRQLAVAKAQQVNIVSLADPKRFIALISNLPQVDLINLATTIDR